MFIGLCADNILYDDVSFTSVGEELNVTGNHGVYPNVKFFK